VAAFPEVQETPTKRKRRSAFPDVEGDSAEPVVGAEAGLLESLPGVPEQLLNLIGSGLSPQIGTENIASHIEDVVNAQAGDLDAARRARSYETALTVGSAVLPGGPEVKIGAGLGKALLARAGLGALGGGVAGGAESAARGEDFLPGAARGAALGGILGPALGLGQGFLARRAAARLASAGKAVPESIARKAAEEATREAEKATGLPSPDPVKRVIEALKEVPDLRGKQEALFKAERGKRIRMFRKAGEGAGGESGARSQMRTLSGELPKVEFGSLRPIVNQGDIDSIFDIVKNSPILGEWERPRAVSAMLSLFEPGGFKLPTRSELAVLEKALGTEFVETLIAKGPQLSKMKRLGMEILSAPRTLQASFDLSAPLRQGLFLGAGHPKEFASAFKGMLTGLGTKKGTEALELAIAQDPAYELALRGGLAITKAGSVTGRQEEQFAGNLLRKLPGVGFSERAYTGFLSKLRFDVFKSMVTDAQRAGLNLGDDEVVRKLASFVNAASGRGDLPKSIAKHAETLNALFFSPRLMAARIQTLNPALYIKSDPVVRKHALRSLLSLGSIASTAVGLSKLAGADTESDMTSPDWGKIKVGNTRYDILGGYQQYLRMGARVAQGFAEGEGVSERVTKGFQPTLPFLRAKLAPIPSLIADLWKGTDFAGREVDVPLAIRERFTPMILGDMWEAAQEWGWMGIPMAAPSIFGVGVNTYEG
jgi:hypothetical protein